MTGSTLTALAANPASSLETSTLSSTVSTAAASVTAASTIAASAARNTWTSNFSSIVQSFVPLRFAIFFTQKYSALNSLPRRRNQVSPGSKPLPSRVRPPLVLELQGRGSSTTIFSLPGDWAEFDVGNMGEWLDSREALPEEYHFIC